MTDQAINYRKKCDMAQNNRGWNRGQNRDKTKKKMTHALKILSIKKEHTYVRLHCKYRHHTVYMNHSHQIVKYIQLKLDVQKSL